MDKGGAPSQRSAVVLLSAGLDSTYNLLRTLEQYQVRLALTFNYGQKAAAKEIARAQKIAQKFSVPHQVVDLPWFHLFTKTSLVGAGEEIPSGHEVQIDSLSRSLETAKQVWVPNRNGILLNIAAGFAEGLGAQAVVPGFNFEEAQTFPDNTGAFLMTLNESWAYSTSTSVRTVCFTTDLNKVEIVKQGLKLNMPFSLLWPCYLSQVTWCGECESCQRFKRALKANGLSFEQLQKEAALEV